VLLIGIPLLTSRVGVGTALVWWWESTRNIWAHSLSAILLNKSCEKLLKSKQAVDFLTESNETIIDFIKKVKLDEKKANEMRLSIKLSQGS
jgi:hypothetical protein